MRARTARFIAFFEPKVQNNCRKSHKNVNKNDQKNQQNSKFGQKFMLRMGLEPMTLALLITYKYHALTVCANGALLL
ncbi:hypothetical protein L596_000843 [Steinernema carpocapsae]|uniref:Uncharacterized protein n=1 Tax=Steinernema carpocapsae TaxID=34508 RepID=A0A4U8UJM0_STECR|nr:hypothetical protein L596_000843 [Steinernema carpocapsae]